MPPDLLFAVSVAVKMTVTAVFFVSATFIAERAGPVVGGLVSTLPISSGPAYAMLALDHDAAFIAAAALGSFVVTAAICVFALVYVALAQRHSLAVSVGVAAAIWIAATAVLQLFTWTTASAVVLVVAVFAVCLTIGRRYRHAPRKLPIRRWYDAPLRAALVAALVGLVIVVSGIADPALTGMITAFPIVMFSLMLILHSRLGGPGAAALLANSMIGLIGFSLFCLMLHVSVGTLGFVAAVVLAVVANAGFNLMIWLIHRRRLRT